MNTRDAVRLLRAEYPFLSVAGLHAPSGPVDRTTLVHLLQEAWKHEEQTELCSAWLSECAQTKHVRKHVDTYRYKHEVEGAYGVWVPHLSMIVAAKLAGLDVVQNPERTWAALLPLGARRPGMIPGG